MKKNGTGRGRGIFVLAIAGLFIIIFIFSFFSFSKSPKDQATKAINEFYTFEQSGNFSESWEMFHPLMQQKFDKGYYIQDRAHVFMNHFGVTTFTYSLNEPSEVTNWSMEGEDEPIDQAFQFTISQSYNSKYGNFKIVQNVYVTELEGEWRILWDYNQN